MPVEIGELIINARVVPDPWTTREQANRPRPAAEQRSQEEIVERCVTEILRILEDRRER